MNVLLIGSGGREHALAWKLAQSPRLTKLYAAPGSDAIAEHAELRACPETDFPALTAFCRERKIDLVVVGPEAPLAAGLADALGKAGVPVFGPTRAAARLESSKSFAKDFLRRHGIPTARAESHTGLAAARAALARFGLPVVVKADGLAAGKGVRVCPSRPEAESALSDFLESGVHGEAGRRVVLEEHLAGRELTYMGLCDGKSFLALPPSSDHKRLADGDRGPNTGGMGVLAPTPEADAKTLRRVQDEIVAPVLAGLKADGIDYCGVLYCGLMLTAEGPKVLEFNCRFGDPETQAVLPLMESDLLELMEAAVKGSLARKKLEARGAAVTVVLASEGYPERPVVGREIRGLDDAARQGGALVFHAGTRKDDQIWKTKGGRVLGVTGLGKDLGEARARAYAAARKIRFDGMQSRTDIAAAYDLEQTR